MRPRLFTAEINVFQVIHGLVPPRFNEAAAIHRGNHYATVLDTSPNPRFNEAAAIHRGNLLLTCLSNKIASCFNEAAAIHRGNRD